ncbi:neutral zinc metallopeptidase [Kribbella voronezhensis]|uniref:neutral zinc metallopeptidase n=1 Tax=Kribbella voronezhensis TaxID=2512212 RepID=UPI00141707B7|nr:neutral zinc metallopeptidase [Kribbella voronezhensis]
MNRTRGRKLIAGGAALLAFGIIAVGAISWDRHQLAQADPQASAAAAEASEAAKARAALPSTTPSSADPTADDVAAAPPQPAQLTKNPLYRVGKLPATGCTQPEQEPTSVANVRAFQTELLGCLNRAWAPVIRKAGFTFKPPKLVVVKGKSPSSPCDTDDSDAYYCGDTIYVDATAFLDGWRYNQGETLAYLTFLLDHEYGHHIQALTGILRAEYQWQLPLSGVDLSLQGSRRIELQANCLSGVSLGADQDTYLLGNQDLTDWQALVRNFIDPKRDHGSTENAANWSLTGYDTANPKACNTFTAPTPLVA